MIKHQFSDFSYAINTTSAKEGFKEILVCFMYNGTEVLKKIYIKEGPGVSYVFEAKKIVDQEMRDGTLAAYSHKFAAKNKRKKAQIKKAADSIKNNKVNETMLVKPKNNKIKWIFATAGIAALVGGASATITYFATRVNDFNVYFISDDCVTSSKLKTKRGEHYSCELKLIEERENVKPSISKVTMGNDPLKEGTDYEYNFKENKLNIKKATNDSIIIVAKGVTAEDVIATPTASDIEISGDICKVTNVTIPFGFDKNTVTNVVIPTSISSEGKEYKVTEIKEGLLNGYGNLTDITLPFIGLKDTYNVNDKHENMLFGSIFGSNDYSGGVATWQDWYEDDGSEGGLHKMTKYVIPNDLSDVVISNVGEQIVDGAFSECSHINDIVVKNNENSNSIKIGNLAFNNCTSLESFKHDGVTINEYSGGSFYNCTALTGIDLTGTEKIGKSAFGNCSSLIEVIIPKSVITVEDYAFLGASGLIVIEKGTNYSSWPENWVGSTTAVIYDADEETKILTDSSNTFKFIPTAGKDEKGNAIETAYVTEYIGDQYETELIIPNTLKCNGKEYPIKFLGTGLFYQYIYFENIIFESQSLVTIGNYCFASCSGLESISFKQSEEGEEPIKYSLSTIGTGAFQNCSKLVIDDTVDVTNTEFECGIFPETLETINEKAFYKCKSIKNLAISNVKSIGESAFEECINLVDIKIHAGSKSFGKAAFLNATKFSHVGKYYDDKTMPIDIDKDFKEIPEECFKNTSIGDDSSTIPYYVEKIGANAFENTLITILKFPERVIKPDSETEYFPTHLKYIGEYAFSGCSSLKTILYLEQNTTIESLGEGAFYNCESLQYVRLENCEKLTTIPKFLCYGCVSLEKFCPKEIDNQEKSSVIPSNITSIGDYAFANCLNLGYTGGGILSYDFDKAFYIVDANLKYLGKGVFSGWFSKLLIGSYIFNGGQLVMMSNDVFNKDTKETTFGWKLNNSSTSGYYTCDESIGGTKALLFTTM